MNTILLRFLRGAWTVTWYEGFSLHPAGSWTTFDQACCLAEDPGRTFATTSGLFHLFIKCQIHCIEQNLARFC